MINSNAVWFDVVLPVFSSDVKLFKVKLPSSGAFVAVVRGSSVELVYSAMNSGVNSALATTSRNATIKVHIFVTVTLAKGCLVSSMRK